MRLTHDNPVITSHRLGRLTRRAMLWLLWIVGLCRKFGIDLALSGLEPWMPLARMRREVRNLVFLHAFMRLRPPTPSHRYRDGRLKGSGLGRAVIGSRLRRAVRDAGLVELIALLHAPEAEIARLVRRLRKGLTRRRRVRFAPISVLAPTFALCTAASADTS